MTRTITTITDARHIVAEWTARYDQQPTPEQLDRAARALVRHIGGYGKTIEMTDAETGEVIDRAESFDLTAALGNDR